MLVIRVWSAGMTQMGLFLLHYLHPTWPPSWHQNLGLLIYPILHCRIQKENLHQLSILKQTQQKWKDQPSVERLILIGLTKKSLVNSITFKPFLVAVLVLGLLPAVD